MENNISALETRISSATDQREIINLKNLLAESLRPVNIVQSLEISNEVIELGKEYPYPEGTALGYRNAGCFQITMMLFNISRRHWRYIMSSMTPWEKPGS